MVYFIVLIYNYIVVLPGQLYHLYAGQAGWIEVSHPGLQPVTLREEIEWDGDGGKTPTTRYQVHITCTVYHVPGTGTLASACVIQGLGTVRGTWSCTHRAGVEYLLAGTS